MSDFDTSKWFKNKYLAEANLTEEKLTYTPPDVFFAIYDILKSEVPGFEREYGTASYFGMQMAKKLDMYGPGEEILMGLKEAPESMVTYKVEVVLAADEGGPDYSEDIEVEVDSSLKGDELNSAIRNAVYGKGYTRRSIYKINYKK